MNWRDYIELKPGVLAGKPVVAGTRLSVDFILDLLAEGWTEEQVLKNYPGLTADALQAVFALAAESMRDSSFYPLAESGR